MLLPDLKKVASSLGVKSSGLRKAELVAAIRAHQGANGGAARTAQPAREQQQGEPGDQAQRSTRRRASRPEGAPQGQPSQDVVPAPETR
ncbi:MAG TPA: transcription termination factor Rho, partial [Propionibacterium sp.]|nr:transcription termination factor Rho [Propionibacterium sp.]